MLDLAPDEWMKRLVAAHDRELSKLKLMDSYYEGDQPLSYMAPELLMELDDRLRQVVVNWPKLVVDALDERLDVEGFRYAGGAADLDLWRIWQANDLDEGAQQAHVDALALSRSYVIVGAGDEADTPIISAESAQAVYAERDPRTRAVVAAVKRWDDPVPTGSAPVKRATLYLPEATIPFAMEGGKWAQGEVDAHGLGTVPVVPMVNQPRLQHPDGVSELKPVIPLSDAACKVATDMMVAAEYHAMPRRWATGIAQDDFADAEGRPLSALSQLAGRIWANEDPNVHMGQFPESTLANFHDTIDALAKLVASITGMPPHYLGMSTDQPASADAIRSNEARLVKRAERRQRAFGAAWERVMRLAILVRDGEADPRAASLETVWKDASTPTFAQQADAVVKLTAAGVVPVAQAREDLGYSAVQQEQMKKMDADAAARVMGGDLASMYGPKPAPPSAELAAVPEAGRPAAPAAPPPGVSRGAPVA